MAYPKHYTHKGKWTLKRLIKEAITSNDGELPLKDLLNHLKKQGYHKESIQRSLEALDVEVTDGVARMRRWQSG